MTLLIEKVGALILETNTYARPTLIRKSASETLKTYKYSEQRVVCEIYAAILIAYRCT